MQAHGSLFKAGDKLGLMKTVGFPDQPSQPVSVNSMFDFLFGMAISSRARGSADLSTNL